MLVLAPARIGFLDRWASDLEGARREAQRRLVITVASLAKAGVVAEARVGDEDLVQAVEDQLQSFAATDVILVTGDAEEDPAGEAAASELERAAAGRVPPPCGQRSSSSLKRSAARVGSTKASWRWRRPAPLRSRTARSIASRSAKLGRLAGDLADEFGDGHLGWVKIEQSLQDGGLGGGVVRRRGSSCRRSRPWPWAG